jgi:hypothetical protein
MGDTGYFRRLYEAAKDGYNAEDWGDEGFPTASEELACAAGYTCGGIVNLFRDGPGASIYVQESTSKVLDLNKEREPNGIDAVVEEDSPDEPADM